MVRGLFAVNLRLRSPLQPGLQTGSACESGAGLATGGPAWVSRAVAGSPFKESELVVNLLLAFSYAFLLSFLLWHGKHGEEPLLKTRAKVSETEAGTVNGAPGLYVFDAGSGAA